MDIVLILPKTKEVEFENIEVPYSILWVGSYLSHRQINVKLFDERVTGDKDILNYVHSHKIEYVGVSTMTGPQLKYAIAISRKIKELDNKITLIWGGVHPTILPETVLFKNYVDFVVRGEGEETLYELLSALEKGNSYERVQGISYRNGKTVTNNPFRRFMDLDSVSMDWSLLDMSQYIYEDNGKRSISFTVSRGCHFRCRFCWNVIVHNRKWRSWSLDKAKEEIENLIAKFGINYVNFIDDNLSSGREYLFDLAEFLKRKNVGWFASLRVDFLSSEENIKRLDGCDGLYVGSESGDDRILLHLQKDATVDQIVKSAQLLKKYGIKGNFSWMVGFPGETRDEVLKTIELVDEVAKIMPTAAQRVRIWNPYPGSSLFEEAVGMGFKPPKELEGWSNFTREYCVLDYVKNPWELKCISYVTFFYFYQGARRSAKLLYKPILLFLRKVSSWRWRNKIFKFPIEFYLIEKIRELISPVKVGRSD